MHGLMRLWKMRQILRDARETFCLGSMLASLVVAPLPAVGRWPEKPVPASVAEQKNWNEPLTPDEKIRQLLNRITFGPRPGDIDRARQIGIKAFLEEQLHPEKINDSAVEARVAALPTLSMTPEELAENFSEMKKADGRFARQATQGSPDSLRRDQASNEMSQPTPPVRQDMMEMQGPRRVIMELAQEEVLRAIYSNRQLQEMMVQSWMNHFNIFASKGADKWLTTSFERDTIRPRSLGKFEDLLVATAKSPAMLFYLDNWMSATPNPTFAGNFNGRPGRRAPFGGRGQVFRPLGRGRFGQWRPFGGPFGNRRAQGPNGQPAAGGAHPPNKRGLNENYAREVMELHTLGVDGGYSQKDVVEIARCLTGWTIDRPKRGGRFIFNPRMHDFGEKVVLGHRIRAGQGMEDGLQVFHLLARHPSTAHFIALKLCRRFVADDPPTALVHRASQVFQRSDGDIRAVLNAILTSPEFYSKAAYRAKVKSPLELVASSVRALGGNTDAGVPVLQLIARMGQPMFQYEAPTGFPDQASTWINSSALLMRMNFAMMLASNRIPGTRIDLAEFSSANGSTSPEAAMVDLSRRLVGGTLTPETREAILKKAAEDNVSTVPDFIGAGAQSPRAALTVAALLLASPEFQRR